MDIKTTLTIITLTASSLAYSTDFDQDRANAFRELDMETGSCKAKLEQQMIGLGNKHKSDLSNKNKEIAKLRSTITSLETQINQSEKQTNSIDAENAKKLASCNSKTERLKGDLASINNRLKQLQQDNDRLSTDILALKQKPSQSDLNDGQNTELEDKITNLNRQLKKERDKNVILERKIALLANVPPIENSNGIGAVKRIKISSAINNWIQISEVVAIEALTGNDVALSDLGAKAEPSSTGYGGEAFNAIDGVGPAGHPRIFHSGAADSSQYLMVTLSKPTKLSEIKIMGRADNYSSRDVFNVVLYDENKEVILSKNNLDARSSNNTAALNLGTRNTPKKKNRIVGLNTLSGMWTLDANGYKGKLEFYQSDSGLNARVYFDVINKWEPVTNVTIEGSTIKFHRPSYSQNYSGTIGNDRVVGQFTQGANVYAWEASAQE